MNRVLPVLISTLCFGACDLFGPDEQRVLGIIGEREDSENVFPAVVDAGSPFEVTVHTFGSGSCTRPDNTEVSVDGATAVISPYDIRIHRDACTSDLRAFPHPLTLQFDSSGDAVIVLRGHLTRYDDPVVEHRYAVSVR